MSNRSYTEINIHMTWHTKDNLPFTSEHLEPDLCAFIKNRVIQDRQSYFHPIGGIAEHVHLAASFFPPFEIDSWIGQMKGASSFEFGKSLSWQHGYGAVSFGTRDLKCVINYIHDQKGIARAGSRSDSSDSGVI